MKISKEVKTGVIGLLAVGLLVAGVNFLKGNSFFGGDDIYYATFPNSAGVTAATSVVVDGVPVGKVLNVEWTGSKDSLKRVKITFNIQEKNFKIPKTSVLEAGAVDLFTKGLILRPGVDLSKGVYKPGDEIQGQVLVDLTAQVKSMVDPIAFKVTTALTSIDQLVNSFSGLLDTNSTNNIKGSLRELQIAIHKLGNVAEQVDNLVEEEKIKLSKILSNVESITANIQKSNSEITAILGNARKFSDDLVTADFKGTIENAKQTLDKFNTLMASINAGEGTLGKLVKDDQLFNELNKTNQRLQNLVEDIQIHPERYIHVSVFGAKTKGAPLSPSEERKLKKILDTIPE